MRPGFMAKKSKGVKGGCWDAMMEAHVSPSCTEWKVVHDWNW